jgi:hypothetical protein
VPPVRIAFCIFILAAATAHTQERPFSLSVFGTFISSSKLFHHPDDPEEIVRSEFLPLDDIFSAGVDFRRVIEHARVQAGLSLEYISKSELVSVPLSSSISVPVVDGFTAFPLELSGYFFIPLGDERIQFYMGGGGGIYFGTRTYMFGGAEAVTVDRQTGYGIHILSGVEYSLKQSVSLRSEIKFRDVQFKTSNRFETLTMTYLGKTILLDQSTLNSRISIDGMTVTLGVVYHF